MEKEADDSYEPFPYEHPFEISESPEDVSKSGCGPCEYNQNNTLDDLNIKDEEVLNKLPPPVTIVRKDEWSKMSDSKYKEKYNKIVQNVLVTHTGTDSCKNDEECVRTVRMLQQHHVALGYADIIYNFLIGGNGKVYEGRGWTWKGGMILKYPESFGDVIRIAHIGYYGDESKKRPRESTIKLMYDLIQNGMHEKYVPWNATIIPDFNE